MRKSIRLSAFIILIILGFLLLGQGLSLLFREYFFDNTSHNQYSLSNTGQQIAASLPDDVNINLYYSPQISKEYPTTGVYFDYVLKIMQQLQDSSDGKITLKVVYLNNDEKSELEAAKIKLKPFISKDGKSNLYFGALLRNSAGDSIRIPNFTEGRRNQVEADLSRALVRLTQKQPLTTIGLIAPDLDFGASNGSSGLIDGGSWNIFRPLASEYLIQRIPTSAVQISADINTVIVVNPAQGLSKLNLYALDQFLLRGGNIILFADSLNEHLLQPNSAAMLNQFLQPKGISINDAQVIGNINDEGQLRTSLSLSDANINHSHILTQGINLLSLYAPAQLVIEDTASDTSVITTLASASGSTVTIPVADYQQHRQLNQSSQTQLSANSPALISLVEGEFNSVFEDNIIKDSQQRKQMLSFLPQSVKSGKILIIGDIDFLYNDQWSDSRSINDNPIYGIIPTADNGDFLLKSIDYFSGRNNLLRYSKPQPPSTESLNQIFTANAKQQFSAEHSQIIHQLEQAQSEYVKLTRLAQTKALNYAEIKRMEEVSAAITEGEKSLHSLDYAENKNIQTNRQRFILLNIFAMALLLFVIVYGFRRYIRSQAYPKDIKEKVHAE